MVDGGRIGQADEPAVAHVDVEPDPEVSPATVPVPAKSLPTSPLLGDGGDQATLLRVLYW